ncbi:hypothetical protein CW751_10055 [Brumimicrobium salinarum]|uniref:Alkaline phytoceramidase n=1 Tax=Brumimicrobium salinarum TaxID=2058658 RepID=A0A2I0R1E9_9FLAO|nr:hypothetical protein [Brumimicrobium salinarum]PKR80403.1 hypothetical protein CW751_10055 [Brumimicrobium salinarum]
MKNPCNIPAEKLPFDFMGLCLQEPMALVTNMLIAITCFVIFYKFNPVENKFQKHWKLFYLLFGLSTFFSGFGHMFFNYSGIYGKFPTWILGLISAFHAGKAMISLNVISPKTNKILNNILLVKLIGFTVLAVVFKSFVFVMADAVITYLFFCMGMGLYYWKKGLNSFKYTVIAVLVLIPSIFIFTLQFNPHLWFNKEDLSHVLMVTTIIFFYIGIIRLDKIDLEKLVSINQVKYVNK